MVSAILLLAGSGTRFESSLPKQFHHLSGRRIYLHTLQKFIDSALFQEIILVCHPEWIDLVKTETSSYPKLRVIPGKETRQASSFCGIEAASGDYVLIHDAVRPFVSIDILKENIVNALLYGAVDTCIPSTDTVVRSLTGVAIDTIPPRSHYFRGQTPQTFRRELILKAHLSTQQTNSTDDCSLLLESSYPIHLVAGSEWNMKITTNLDLFLAEHIFRLQPHSTAPLYSLAGKRFAITGGTGGIGSAIASFLAAEGAEPLLLSRSAPIYRGDLSDEAQSSSLFRQIGPLDGLINCVGSLSLNPIHLLLQSQIEGQIASNFTSVVHSCRFCELRPQSPILNIASSAAYRGRPHYAIYSSMKAAVINFSQALAQERPDLFVNVLVPQRTDTALRRENFPQEEKGLLLSPDEVAKRAIEVLKSKMTGMIVDVKCPISEKTLEGSRH